MPLYKKRKLILCFSNAVRRYYTTISPIITGTATTSQSMNIEEPYTLPTRRPTQSTPKLNLFSLTTCYQTLRSHHYELEYRYYAVRYGIYLLVEDASDPDPPSSSYRPDPEKEKEMDEYKKHMATVKAEQVDIGREIAQYVGL